MGTRLPDLTGIKSWPGGRCYLSSMSRLWLLGLLVAACSAPAPPAGPLVVAAVEGDGTLAVLDARTGELVRAVDLSQEAHGGLVRFLPHNVQAAGQLVWATAMPDGSGGHAGMADQLIGVDLARLQVVARIDLGEGVMAAHVVVVERTAFVTASVADAVLAVDLARREVSRTYALPEGTYPHGLRATSTGGTLVVAGMDGSMHVIDVASGQVTTHLLPARAVQAAILPDDRAAYVTIYDTRQVARLELATGTLALWDLPAGSAGPIQLHPSPDGSSLWIAHQGLLDGDPAGTTVSQLDAHTGLLLREVTVDPGPHGVVVSADGALVWITTLAGGTVQAIDTASGQVRTTTSVGERPNGITVSP
jgi:DNA-binding beta-propeller fold protein YncE